MKRVIAILIFVLLLINTSLNVYALDSSSSVSVGIDSSNLDVTIPTSLPIWIDSSSNVTVSTDVYIFNNSIATVELKDINTSVLNDWVIRRNESQVTGSLNDTKNFIMYINGMNLFNSGTPKIRDIPVNSSLPIEYSAIVSFQTESMLEYIANVEFVVGWKEPPPTSNMLSKQKLSSAIPKTASKITFTKETALTNKIADVSEEQNVSIVVYGDISLGNYEVVSNDVIKFPKDSSNMFSGYTRVTEIVLDNIDTSNVLYMDGMFFSCGQLASLDLRNLDTSNVTSLSWFLASCYNLAYVDLSSFDTSNVQNMSNMFFEGSSLVDVNLSSFNTSSLVVMDDIFKKCYSIKTIDLSSFTFDKVKDFTSIFDTSSTVLQSIYLKDTETIDFIKLQPIGLTNLDILKLITT